MSLSSAACWRCVPIVIDIKSSKRMPRRGKEGLPYGWFYEGIFWDRLASRSHATVSKEGKIKMLILIWNLFISEAGIQYGRILPAFSILGSVVSKSASVKAKARLRCWGLHDSGKTNNCNLLPWRVIHKGMWIIPSTVFFLGVVVWMEKYFFKKNLGFQAKKKYSVNTLYPLTIRRLSNKT